jgi:hypothetical protein
MPVDITVTLTSRINESMQVGDIAYYATPSQRGGQRTVLTYNAIKKMGPVKSITRSGAFTGGTIVINLADDTAPPSANDFLFFSKDNLVNLASVLGYYAEVKFVNTSTEEAEMFQMALETSESSK